MITGTCFINVKFEETIRNQEELEKLLKERITYQYNTLGKHPDSLHINKKTPHVKENHVVYEVAFVFDQLVNM